MSFFQDLVGNAAIVGGRYLEGEIEQGRAKERMDYANELAMAREKTMESLKAERAKQSRLDQRKEIETETGRIADEQITAKRGLIGEGGGNRSLPPIDRQAAVDQSLALDRQGLINSTDTRIQAGRNLGYVSDMDSARYEQTKDAAKRQGERDAVGDAERKADRESVERRHRESMGQGAAERQLRVESLQMDVREKKEAKDLLTRYETEKDPTLKTALHESLVLRGVIKKSEGEYDKREITNETPNAGGGTTTTKDTLRVARGGQSGSTEQKAHADAASAIQTGRINLADANKRLAAAGFKPLPESDAGAAETKVPNRPMYSAKQADLLRISTKPRGVSSAEANEAMAELDARKGEQRMTGK